MSFDRWLTSAVAVVLGGAVGLLVRCTPPAPVTAAECQALSWLEWDAAHPNASQSIPISEADAYSLVRAIRRCAGKATLFARDIDTHLTDDPFGIDPLPTDIDDAGAIYRSR